MYLASHPLLEQELNPILYMALLVLAHFRKHELNRTLGVVREGNVFLTPRRDELDAQTIGILL